MLDMEKVIKGLNCCIKQGDQGILDCDSDCPYGENGNRLDCWIKMNRDALALLKEQEGIIKELLDLGYPHNFQREAPWVVDYLYKLTEIIKKAFKAREGR